MTKFINQQEVSEILKIINQQQNILEETQIAFENYLHYINENKIDSEEEEGTDEEKKIRLENVLSHLQEVVKRRNDMKTNSQKLIENANKMIEFCGTQEEIEKIHDKLLEQLMDVEKRIYEKKMQDLMMMKINPIPLEIKGFIDREELDQLEQWTNKKCDQVIFDSEKDKWGQNTSVFDERVKGKNNLIFVIEDRNRNKFGGYVSSTIRQCNAYTSDTNLFLFSLKSNNRINGMMKFEIQSCCSQSGLYVCDKSCNTLFKFGRDGDLIISKENCKSSSQCYQTSYSINYHGIQNALIGMSGYFTPKRIIVIEMK